MSNFSATIYYKGTRIVLTLGDRTKIQTPNLVTITPIVPESSRFKPDRAWDATFCPSVKKSG